MVGLSRLVIICSIHVTTFLDLLYTRNMTLNLSKVRDTYFDHLFIKSKKEQNASDVLAKVLLLDRTTTSVVSMCYTQSQLLQQEIVLIELLEKQNLLSYMKHMDCIVYIKPTTDSITTLLKELRNPHFGSYRLFFNNTANKSQLEQIAEADDYELVQRLVELFQDYLTINDNLFMLEISPGAVNPYMEESNSLISLLLSLKKCPIIRFESNSLALKKLSSELLYAINSNSNNNLFEDLNKKSDRPPVLLLLDRKSDPITPLLMPWTYQSMIHELIGIEKNIIHLKLVKEPVTLLDSNDVFFKEAAYLNYGDLTDKFQRYVEDYKKQTKLSSIENLKTQNLVELKNMLTKFPQFRKLLNNILKHLNIISELDNQISSQNMWELGELQQVIASNLETQASIKPRMISILENRSCSTTNKVKLVLLYMARFHANADLDAFISRLSNPGFTSPTATTSQISLMKSFGVKFKTGDVFEASSHNTNNISNLFNKKISINQLFNNTNSRPPADNVFMQYIPALNDILSPLIKPSPQSNDSSSKFNTLIPESVKNQYGNVSSSEPAQDIIIYIKGGATYEEARLVHELSASNPSINILLGGDKILNSEDWVNDLYDSNNDEVNVQTGVEERRAQLRDIL